jgi:hypothetical protein
LVPIGVTVSEARIYGRDGQLTSAASWASCSCVIWGWLKVKVVEGESMAEKVRD